MTNVPYYKMLEPYRLPNGILLKNRMEAAPSGMHFLQGPEPFPNEAIIDNYSNKAKNGAAVVVVQGCSARWKANPFHMRSWDITDGHNHHYIAMMNDVIHSFNSKSFPRFDIDQFIGRDYDVSTGVPTAFVVGDGTAPRYDCVEAPEELLLQAVEEYSDYCRSLKYDMGFDGVWMHMAYRHMFLGRCLSPLTNKRTDRFGGSLENQFAFPLLVAKRVKEKCGRDFIIEASISGHDPEGEGGLTLDDVCKYVKMAEGYFDILQVKSPWIDEAHPIQFHSETPWLYMSEKLKSVGANVAIAASGGYFKPDTCERVLEEEKADLISMARSWISNFDYGKLVQEGRAEDITPCLRCNKCHKSSNADPWVSVCSVNPVIGLEHRIDKMTAKTEGGKKVAVIGGGPAGMEAALVASRRGHNVTLYEKSGRLGGQLCITENVDFKWTLQDFRRFLIAQIGKSNVKVLLNSTPTKEELEKEGYDVVMAALGAEPLALPIPGAKGDNVMFGIDAYANLDKIADDVVIIGGGEIGVETGIWLARNGRNVTVLEMRGMLSADSTPVHYWKMFRDEWQKLDNFTGIVNAKVSEITADGVFYTDENGEKQFVRAGTVLMCAGMRAKDSEAAAYYGAAPAFYMVGDCRKASCVQKVMRSAYITASQF